MNIALAALLGVCLTTATAASADNKDVSSEPSVIVYKIKAGDTANKLARKHMVQPVDLDAIHKANQLHNIDLLPIGFDLNIPRHLVKSSPSKATIMGVSCATAIRLKNSSQPLTVGTHVSEGAVIEVPAECHVSLLLEDSSIIRLPSSAQLKITTLRKNALESAPEVKLDLARGRMELDVNKNRGKTTPFEIRTPLSIMGVRGTEFRVGYSPDDGSAQVEVLGGIVETRGNTDAQSRAITKGFGVPIAADGKALPTEKLLEAPLFQNAQATPGSQPSFVAALSPIPQANFYIANSANTANFGGTQVSQHLLAPEIFIPKLTKQISFYQLTSVSESGLVGTERNYGFCATPTEPANARCTAIFDASLADGVPMSFTLFKTVDGAAHQLVNTQTLQARNGRFAIQGLPAGHYTWSLSYALSDASNSRQIIRQLGAFELIALSTQQP
jgi:hypothetical protein